MENVFRIMAEVNFQIFQGFFSSLAGFISLLSSENPQFKVLFWAVTIAVISIFIWRFYKSTSKRNIIELNLKKYNYSNHPVLRKFFASLLYLVEYIIITPILLILWYAGLSIILLLIARERTFSDVLFMSAAVVGGIRILTYLSDEEVAKELAKLFPFIALAELILAQNFFDSTKLVEQVLQIPALLNNIFAFIFVIFMIELVLRIFHTVYDFYSSSEE